MDIAAYAVLLPADHHGDLAVDLQSEKSVDDMAACLFKHFCPGNIMLLVKSRLELDEDRDLLPVIGCPGKSSYDRRVPAHAVQRLFDCQDIGIHGSFLYESDDRVERHIRMMYEDIPVPDNTEDILFPHKCRDGCRIIPVRFIGVKSRKSVHLHEEGEIDRPRNEENVVARDIEFFRQHFKKTLIHAFFDLKADDLSPLALFQLLLDLLQEVLCLLLVDVKLRVPHDPVRISAENIIMLKEHSDILADDFFKQNDDHVSVLRIRQTDDPRKYCRDLDSGELRRLFLLLRLFRGDQRSDIEGLVPDQRERSGGIHGHRSEDRIDLRFKISVQESTLCLRQFRMIFDDLKACFEKRRDKRPVINSILVLDELLHLCGNKCKLIPGCEAGDVSLLISCVHLILERRHTDHIEFIKVRRRDTQELDPLKERNDIAVSRLRQAAAVELQPGELPVPVIFRISEIDRILYCRGILCLIGLLLGSFLSRHLCLRFGRGFSLSLHCPGRSSGTLCIALSGRFCRSFRTCLGRTLSGFSRFLGFSA